MSNSGHTWDTYRQKAGSVGMAAHFSECREGTEKLLMRSPQSQDTIHVLNTHSYKNKYHIYIKEYCVDIKCKVYKTMWGLK